MIVCTQVCNTAAAKHGQGIQEVQIEKDLKALYEHSVMKMPALHSSLPYKMREIRVNEITHS